MTDLSRIYRENNYKGDRIIIELSFDDAQAIFADCKRDQNPIQYLREAIDERYALKAYVRRAHWSAILFVLVLFFFRRFIP